MYPAEQGDRWVIKEEQFRAKYNTQAQNVMHAVAKWNKPVRCFALTLEVCAHGQALLSGVIHVVCTQSC